MLSYQHAYHAGNFADVHKHLTLYAVQQYLLRKESPITFIDAHAGRGRYPLAAEETRRLGNTVRAYCRSGSSETGCRPIRYWRPGWRRSAGRSPRRIA